MTETYPVDGTPDRPDFGIKVGGADVEPAVKLDVLEIDVSEEVGRHARATLLLRNWAADTRTVTYADGDLFAPGAEVEVSLGWQGELVPVFAGVVTAVTGHFGTAAGPTLEVACRSRSTLLATLPRTRTYEDATDGDVVSDLAAAYGLTADAENGPSQPAVAWQRTADWDWLVARAERLGWVTYVRDKTLVFRPAAQPSDGDLTLAYGTTVRELRIAEDVAGMPETVRAHGWSAGLEPVDAEAETGLDSEWPLREADSGTPAAVGSDEVDALARAGAEAAKARRRSGRGATIGLPRLRCDSWLRLDGIGSRLGGSHYVSAVRHRMGRAGFTTEFQLGLPAPLVPPPAAPAAATTLAAGVVADLDDPLGHGRVKVRFPWLPAADPVWARLAVLDAGPSQGTWFVPDVDQEVVVGWLDADRRFPVVLGALWNDTQQPPESMDAAKNDVRAVVTRSGHRLAFDDKQDGTVTLTTAGGHAVVLDDGAGSITLTEKGGTASLTLSSDGIVLEAKSGDVTLKAPAGKVAVEAGQLDAAATGPAKVSSSATLDLTASATLTASGALVRIN
jgi:phage protein D/phage baseplate assembly protein gpV